jgi:predicted GIY-YIG superfamily endonuclease
LVYSELFQTRDEAWLAEQKIKGWGRKKKEILIRHGFAGFKK